MARYLVADLDQGHCSAVEAEDEDSAVLRYISEQWDEGGNGQAIVIVVPATHWIPFKCNPPEGWTLVRGQTYEQKLAEPSDG